MSRAPCPRIIDRQTVRGSIDWEEHLETHAAYVRKNTGRVDFKFPPPERIAQTGGFGYAAVENLLGHKPKTWRPDIPLRR